MIYNEPSRCHLINIILRVGGRTPEQIRLLIEDLKSLVSCLTNDEIEDGRVQFVSRRHFRTHSADLCL